MHAVLEQAEQLEDHDDDDNHSDDIEDAVHGAYSLASDVPTAEREGSPGAG